MEKLIPMINKIRSVTKHFRNCNFPLNLPEIVVVGEQSAGKSSVLETLVGQPCLPRGTGTATLCPIRIELNKLDEPKKVSSQDNETQLVEEYAELPFLPDGNNIVTDFSKLCGLLEGKMKELSPDRKIVSKEIVIKIFSTKSPNLTLVDLPGRLLDRSAGQDVDDIDDLVRSYIKNPNCIILAITIASQDHNASLALQAARWEDPDLQRTLVVVTKLDQRLPGEEISSLLDGSLLETNLGIIGVINRSTEAKEGKNQTIEQKREKEEKFLRERYGTLGRKHGSKVLRSRLEDVLMDKIKNSLPQLKAQIDEKRATIEANLMKFGDPTPEGVEKSDLVANLLAKFYQLFSDTVLGNGGLLFKPSRKTNIAVIMDAELRSKIPTLELNDEEISCVIDNTQRLESGITVIERGFQEVMRPQIGNLANPARNCAKRVKDQLVMIVKEAQDAIGHDLARFPLLAGEIENIMNELLSVQHDFAVRELERYITYLSNYIRTPNVAFNGTASKQYATHMGEPVHIGVNTNGESNTNSDNPSGDSSNSGNTEGGGDTGKVDGNGFDRQIRGMSQNQVDRCKAARTLVDHYYFLTTDQFLEHCPKVIYMCLIKEVTVKMLPLLYSKVQNGDQIQNLVKEDPKITNKREEWLSDKNALDAAEKEINAMRSSM